MMIWRSGTVQTQTATWGEAGEYRVLLDDGTQARALAYFPQVGEPRIGDRVLLSASAVVKGLGTGGYMLVVAIPDRLPLDPPNQPGHIVKARYTPSQFMAQGVDEQESPHHAVLEHSDSIEGMLVIAADLHSSVPAIAAGIRAYAPSATIAYVMNDGGALPAWFSQAIVGMKDHALVCGTITCGQAYGGDLEAVNIYTGLLAARHVWNADVAIVAQGPGNLGTGTTWGFSGVNVGEALNATGILGGSPIAALRMSNADARNRHFGISHHTVRVLTDIVHVPCVAPIPDFSCDDELVNALSAEFRRAVEHTQTQIEKRENITFVRVPTTGVSALLRSCPVPLRTMGRNLDADASSFIAAAAAGVYAASVL